MKTYHHPSIHSVDIDDKGLTHDYNYCLKVLEKIVEAGENADNPHFLLFLQCFPIFPKTFTIHNF